jgi:peroxiredoxin
MSATPIKAGDAIPSLEMWAGFPAWGGKLVDMAALTAGKKAIILGLPGAFTPC